MKMRYFFIIFFVFFGLLAFGNSNELEEIDYLLFLPNSSFEFVNEAQARLQLDNLAGYLINRNLNPGQIFVYGFSAYADIDVDPSNLSMERALFVINELQRRGVSSTLFSEPEGRGTVYLWGDNTTEAGMSPNRRVTIALLRVAEPVVIIPAIEDEEDDWQARKFPWLLLLLLLLIPLVFIFFKSRKKSGDIPLSEPEAAPIKKEIAVNLEEEIRIRAYEHHLMHCFEYVDVEGDWYQAIVDVCASYEANGYQTCHEDGTWWARKFS